MKSEECLLQFLLSCLPSQRHLNWLHTRTWLLILMMPWILTIPPLTATPCAHSSEVPQASFERLHFLLKVAFSQQAISEVSYILQSQETTVYHAQPSLFLSDLLSSRASDPPSGSIIFPLSDIMDQVPPVEGTDGQSWVTPKALLPKATFLFLS